jgi:HK97 family phage portal protein
MKLSERIMNARAKSIMASPYGRSILTNLAVNFKEGYDDFDLDNPTGYTLSDPALQSAWVNICVWMRARNLQRPTYRIYMNAREKLNGPIYDLFNASLADTSSNLWFKTNMWWDLEGEFFWWWGPEYGSGLPKEIWVINPRKITYESYSGKWWYTRDIVGGSTERLELKPETFMHIMEPNPWSATRGIPPIACLAMELEQDIAINKEHLITVRNSTIPEGVLKTTQRISPDLATELSEEWERKHGRNKKNRTRIAVLGSGTEFQPLNPELLKFGALKDINKVAIITKYGLPLKALNAQSERTALSGKDSDEEYKGMWSQTFIPHLKFLQREINAKFFARFGLMSTRGEFDLTEIPELQEDEADLHKRLREDIKVDLITINEARKDFLHRDPLEWGDTPYTELNKKSEPDPKEDGEDGEDGEGKPDPKKDDKKVAFFPAIRRAK